MSIRFKLSLLMLILFATVIGNLIFIFQLERNAEEKLKWVNHTHVVIMEVNEYLNAMMNAETGQRGYIITKNTSYLEPYHRGVAMAQKSFNQLKTLTVNNEAQQERLKNIKENMALKFSELNDTIQLMQNGEATQAVNVVQKNMGKQNMDNIRAILDEFASEERILLEKRKGDFRESRAKVTTLIAIEIVFFLFLSLITATFISRQLFNPLKILLDSTHKMERGEKVSISDIMPKDEMGYLISSFCTMNESVYNRTEQLDYKATHDELTGLKNRTLLFETIQNATDVAVASNSKMAIVFLDLNKFKPLNDTYGHDAGDAMLKETARRLMQCTSEKDLVFRIGGDEFVLLVKNVTHISQIENMVVQIFKSLEVPIMIQGKSTSISASIGVSVTPDNSLNPDELLKMADVAMYESKRCELGRYKFFEKYMIEGNQNTDLSRHQQPGENNEGPLSSN